jgi:CheY-like chemotaxis protein
MLDVLLVDDDDNVRESVAVALLGAGHKVTEACDGAEALDLLASHAFDLAICDVQMPRLDGLTLFRRLRRDAPGTAVIIMTSHGKIPDVVDTLRDGASDYVTKPFDPDEFTQRVVAPIAEHRALRMRFEAARAQLVARDTGACLVAVSPAMRALEGRMALLSQSDASVVITGDRGTGKELVARTLHAQGPRRDGPLVLVDGALLPELLRASELAESGVRDPPAENLAARGRGRHARASRTRGAADPRAGGPGPAHLEPARNRTSRRGRLAARHAGHHPGTRAPGRAQRAGRLARVALLPPERNHVARPPARRSRRGPVPAGHAAPGRAAASHPDLAGAHP